MTYLNYLSDQFSGFHAIVVPGTLRDSMFILDGLLEQQTVLDPKEVMADTASYADRIFGLFFLLGYQFSPRLADLGETRFWRIDPKADYGALGGLARNRVNTELIATNWEDLLRVAGSLATGKVKASDFLRTLHGSSRSATLSAALTELGRIPKTLYSPLAFRNVNLHGRYSFSLPEDVARGELRPLRDVRELDESDE